MKGNGMNFKSSQLKAIILLTSIVATLLFFQNCGRVGVTENVVVDSVTEPVSPLALSVSSQLVVEVLVDTKTSFEVPTKDDSSSIQNISLDSSENKYKAKTQYNGDIDIDIEIWKMSYTPPVLLIGKEDTQLYITGEDGNTLTLEVAFVIKSKTPQLTDLHALIYGDSDQDRQLLENKLNNYEAPGMDVVFARWQSFAAELLFENQAAIEIPAEIGFCDSEQDPITGEFARVVDPETGKTINPGHYSKCANNPFFAAKSWALLPTPDRIYCAANSGKLTGFISPLKFESYLHEAILTSA
ncbi:MAG: hypothetical protein HRT44_08815, partial [Bdellovibrionales bacterium]|nr:hypothetical protein [Bdellovibrionales bacterium]